MKKLYIDIIEIPSGNSLAATIKSGYRNEYELVSNPLDADVVVTDSAKYAHWVLQENRQAVVAIFIMIRQEKFEIQEARFLEMIFSDRVQICRGQPAKLLRGEKLLGDFLREQAQKA